MSRADKCRRETWATVDLEIEFALTEELEEHLISFTVPVHRISFTVPVHCTRSLYSFTKQSGQEDSQLMDGKAAMVLNHCQLVHLESKGLPFNLHSVIKLPMTKHQ